jgi:hypothetical protein
VALAAVVAALWGIAPALVRWQVQRLVGVYWSGQVTIEHIALRRINRIELVGVTMRDGAGTTLAVFPSVVVVVQEADWSGRVAAWLAIRGVTLETNTATGTITLPVTMAGGVTTPRLGTLDLDGWQIDYHDVTVAQEITARIRSSDSGLSIEGPVGKLLGGQMAVTVPGNARAIDARPSGVTVSTDGISLTQLGRLLPPEEQITDGTGAVQLEVLRRKESGWLLRGELRIADADLRGVDFVRKLCHFNGVDDLAPLTKANAEAAFKLDGTAVTITRGRLASDLPEIAIEPGSRIDLVTGRIDASVVLAAGTTLGELPLLHPVGTLIKSLTRVHIHGHLHDPEETLFSRDRFRWVSLPRKTSSSRRCVARQRPGRSGLGREPAHRKSERFASRLARTRRISRARRRG